MSNRRPPLHPITLRFFDDDLERSYLEESVDASLGIVRATLVMGALLFAAYGWLDQVLVPHEADAIWLFRFPIVLLILIAYGLTYVERLRSRLRIVLWSLVVITGFDVAIMMWRWPEELGDLYVTGMMMVFMYAHGHLRLRFIHATSANMAIIACYTAIVPFDTFVARGAILGGASVLCMFASYAIEFFDRKSFWHNMMLMDQRRELENEYARKTQELEAVRRLQLSLLPQEVPGCLPADVAVAMRPALEIGGDYYDFESYEDGGVTFAIGDATGHGAEAGAMVTATKILFATLSREPDVSDILVRSASTLRRVGISKLYMALAVGRLYNGELQLAGAGMPPAIIYRASTGEFEEIPLKGMPLGGFAEFPYTTTTTHVEPGDTIILMSDGFPEAFNQQGEMLGYERAFEIVRSVASLEPVQMIETLMEKAQAWSGDGLISDDITFLVLKANPTTKEGERQIDQLVRRPVATHDDSEDETYVDDGGVPAHEQTALTAFA